MNVGVGLPTTTPGATGELLLEWARRADAGPFTSVAVLDRLVYDSFEPFAVLSEAAGATSRVRLATMIAIGPLRSTALLAKQAASVNGLSGERISSLLTTAGVPFSELRQHRASLEEAYMELTRDAVEY